jgi:hypothetical protein
MVMRKFYVVLFGVYPMGNVVIEVEAKTMNDAKRIAEDECNHALTKTTVHTSYNMASQSKKLG